MLSITLTSSLLFAYYAGFNTYRTKISRHGWPGLSWIDQFNRGRDVLAGMRPDSATRTYDCIGSPGGFGAGMGLMYTAPSRYYRVILSGIAVEPNDFRTGQIDRRLPISTLFLPAETFVPMDFARNPHVRQIILWDTPGKLDNDNHDPLLEKLGPEWRCVSRQVFKLRNHATWAQFRVIRRRVYLHQLHQGTDELPTDAR